MARGNEENTPSKAQNGGTQESRKRKRVVEQGMGDDDAGNKLTSRQLALKQKVESKEAANCFLIEQQSLQKRRKLYEVFIETSAFSKKNKLNN